MTTLAWFREVTAAQMSERDLLAALIEMARDLGYLCYHPWRSDHSESGWPDLALVRANATYGPPRFLLIELKRERGKLSPAQAAWRDALIAAGVEWWLFRPRDLVDGTVFENLRGDVQ